jgi:hypothetical protein
MDESQLFDVSDGTTAEEENTYLDTEEQQEEVLKALARVKRYKTNFDFLKDVYVLGKDEMNDICETQKKKHDAVSNHVEQIYSAVNFFGRRMETNIKDIEQVMTRNDPNDATNFSQWERDYLELTK